MKDEDEGLLERLANRRVTRRDLLVIAGKLGLGAAALGPFFAACGGAATTATPSAMATASETAMATETAAATETPIATATTTSTATAAATELSEREQTLVVGYTQQMSTIDPAVYWEVTSGTVMAALYESLVVNVFHEEDGTVEVVPQLAESWEISPDNLTYTFKLKKGITFHDGEPYNAEAQKFAYERMMDMNEGPAYMLNDYVAKIEAVDESTLKLTLKKPVAVYLQVLAGFWGPSRPLSPKAVNEHKTAEDPWAKEWFNGHAIGTGPYKLDEWVPGQKYVMSKYEGYWRGWQGNHMERVLVQISPEISTQRMLLDKGDVDVIMQPLPPEDLKALTSKPGIVVKKTQSFRLTTIEMHNQRPPTNDLNVRRGLTAAFDYDAAINNIYAGLGLRNATTFSKGMEGYRDDIPLPQKDLEKAKKYFADAGLASGLTIDLSYPEGDEQFRRIAEMYQADLASIGVTLNVRPIAMAAMWDMQAKQDTAGQMWLGAWTPDNVNPYNLVYILWHSKFVTEPGGVNWCFYRNPEVDAILETVEAEPDKAKRIQMYQDLDQMIRDDAAWIVVCQHIDGNAWRDSIKGAVPSPTREFSILPYDVYRG